MKILFVCVGNVGRSQMAEAFFNHAQTAHLGVSAGIKLSGEPASLEDLLPKTQEVIDAMREEGIDVSKLVRKQLTEDLVRVVDRVVVLVEEGECEIPSYVLGASSFEQWPVPDPKGKDLEFTRQVRDQIKERVKKLIGSLS